MNSGVALLGSAYALSQAQVTGRVGSSLWKMSTRPWSTAAPPGDVCSPISLPALQMTTHGWFRSRRTKSVVSRTCHSS